MLKTDWLDRRRLTMLALIAVVVALVLGSIWLAQRIVLDFTFLDLFLIGVTVLALGLNLWQWLTGVYKQRSLQNTLAALFNDLRAKQARCLQRQHFLMNNTPGDAETVRLEFYDSLNESMMSLDQLKEHIVAAIYTLDPTVSADAVLRITEFGLTEPEKELRQRSMELYLEHQRRMLTAAQTHVLPRAETSFGVRDFPGPAR